MRKKLQISSIRTYTDTSCEQYQYKSINAFFKEVFLPSLNEKYSDELRYFNVIKFNIIETNENEKAIIVVKGRKQPLTVFLNLIYLNPITLQYFNIKDYS